ncbi:MAG: VTT domain-containing protein [Proteobacteria bacterium]|nr:VTT domain-containing protein [Pseudomonadota bacterium]MBU0964877.1 VTT domain-containing protein [Pseudomonadota bacterium]
MENTEPSGRVRRFLTQTYARAALPYLAVGLLLIIAIVGGSHELEHHINAIESWITKLGPWGVLAFVGLFTLATSLLVPDTVLCIIAGALFGLQWGAAAVLAGSVLAGTMQFALSHKLLQAWIQRTLAAKPSLAAIQRAVRRDEFRLQVLLRLTPLNPATVSYLLGAAGVRFPGFLIALLALTPNLIIEVYFGHVGKHAARLVVNTSRTADLHDLAIIGGLAVCIVMMLFVSRMAHKAVMQAVTDTDKAEEVARKTEMTSN